MNETSKKRLSTCCEELKKIVFEVDKILPIEVICGHRGEQEQNMCFLAGTSKLQFPNSKHNSYPSQAVDLYLRPLDWNNLKAFHEISKQMKIAAKNSGIKIRWGGDFIKWKDLPHYEIL